jgi:Protein of unknown function (DUF3047)
MTLSRRALLQGLLGVGLPRAARAQAPYERVEIASVENWARHEVGAHGIPAGWRAYETIGGHPRYDFTIVEDDGHRALDMRSQGDHSTIARKLRISLKATPVLEWSWKIRQFPAGADIRRRETSDLAGHLFVVWPRQPAMLRSRLIGYVWDDKIPVNTIETSRKTGTVTFVVVRSGAAELGAWVTERRNVAHDFRKIYGEEPEDAGAVALSIDTNDTRSSAEALFGPIAFRNAA